LARQGRAGYPSRLNFFGDRRRPSEVGSAEKVQAAGRGTQPSGVLRKAQLAIAIGVLVVAASGCGAGEGIAEDAVVTAYVEAPLCEAAREELRAQGGKAGDLRVEATCLPSGRKGEQLSLATLGANARRATEDSTAVAYLEADDPRTARFSHPILETAEIPWISSNSGQAAMSRLLRLISNAGSGSLREQLQTDLNQT
jgi:hypothetical protein